jgi:fatty-acyl-CoA synthase
MQGCDMILSGGTLGDFIVSALERYPERTAFVSDTKSFTYQETSTHISKIVQWFDQNGLRSGDTIAQLSENIAEQWFIMAAAYIAGLRSVTLHSRGSIDDHTYIINDSEAKAVVITSGFLNSLPVLRENCPSVIKWACHDRSDEGKSIWEECAQFRGQKLKICSEPEDIIRLAYTGGTTGLPKGVMLSNRSLVANTFMSLAEKDWPEEIRVLCAASISHGAGGMIVPTLFKGGTIYLHEAFDSDRFLACIQEERITVAYTVPTMLYRILDNPKLSSYDLSSLKLVTYGASPVSPTRLKEVIAAFGPILSQGYGQTEAPASISNLRAVDHDLANEKRLWSCGRPYPGIRVAILDENDSEVPQGSVGEVCVRGPIVMSGYWKRPEETAAAFRSNWLHTGDMGYFDEDGYLYLVDRKKDIIITGGYNVYPREIEDILYGHPDITAAAVIGVPDPDWGESVIAVVVSSNSHLDREGVRALIRERKGPIYTPKRIEIVAELPLTPVGKPDKKRLREEYWQSHERRIG